MTLRTDFITDWVAAMRSGQYPQTQGVLRGMRYPGDGGPPSVAEYCCLGVACEVGIRYGVIERDGCDYRAIGDAEMNGDWNEHTLPNGFWQWIGLDSYDPKVTDNTLTGLNDEHGLSFREIADVVERTWLKEKVRD